MPSISIALVIGSDQEEIYIDANFSGEELLVFGAFYSDPSQSRDSKSDILIEVVGPPEDVACLLYTSDAADDTPCVDLGGRRIIKKKKQPTTP